MKKMSRIAELRQDCAKVGLYFATRSTGTGQMKFHFYTEPPKDYHAGHPIYTAYGTKDAETFTAGWAQAVGAVEQGKLTFERKCYTSSGEEV